MSARLSLPCKHLSESALAAADVSLAELLGYTMLYGSHVNGEQGTSSLS